VKNHVTMDCPHCSVPLVMSDRQGIEIDYCPKCRGVWLDRGELDKIIERSNSVMPQVVQAPSHAPAPQRHYEQQQGYGHKRRKSFLEELFD
jgi:Zn-finger nucleic acid-binding protein